MKTQELKNKESVKSTNLVILVIMIFFCQILLLTSGSSKSNQSSTEINKQKFLTPIHQEFLSQTVVQKLEKDKLFQNMKMNEMAINREIEKNNRKTLEAEFSAAKMNTYLIEENEVELDVNVAQSIIFPDEETIAINADNEFDTDIQLMELKAKAFEKTRLAVEFYALEKKMQAYLIVETEKPLEIEEWMTDAKCWCPELRESTTFAELK